MVSFSNPSICAAGDALLALSLVYAAEAEMEKLVASKGLLDFEAVIDGTMMMMQKGRAGDDKVNVAYDKRDLLCVGVLTD